LKLTLFTFINTAIIPLFVFLIAKAPDNIDGDKVFQSNLFMIFLINMVYPVYWLIDPFYYLKVYQRYQAEKTFKALEDEVKAKNPDTELGNKNLPIESKDYNQNELNL
jgi:hypothetical protein